MWDLINAPQTLIFGVAIMLMLMLGILEVFSLLFGGISDWVDTMLPDSLTDAAHPELGLDAVDAGVFIRFLSWLYVGKIPLLMLMVVFLAIFGLLGYLLQSILFGTLGFYLNGLLAAVAVWFASLPVVRVVAGGLYKIMPKDETTAIEEKSLVGRVGVVVLGEARPGSPAEVRVKDGFGQQHYVMVEPDGEAVLKQGEAVLLVSMQGNIFKAIVNPSGSLVD